MQIRITEKLRKALKIKPSELHEVDGDQSTMGCWYGNVFSLEGKNSILFVNENTLFTFVLVGLTKSNTDKIPDAFKNGLTQALEVNGFNSHDVHYLTQGTEKVSFTKTTNKSVIGSMNDLLYLFESFYYETDDEFNHIIQKINKVPHIKRNHTYAIEAVRDLVANKQI